MRLPFKPRLLNRDRPLKRLDPSKPLDWYMRSEIYGSVKPIDYPGLMDRLLGR